MAFNSISSVEEYLEKIPKFQAVGSAAANFELSRFKDFCKGMDNPQDHLSAIHIAGTNGKGSTCRIIGSVLQQAGYTVGSYTSPHILHFNERFQINGEVIPDDDMLSFFETYADKIEEYRLTYFEISTAIAFWWFDKKEVDVAVIEVGLGGRLDATNILDPLVSVITSISFDHTDILGETLAEIAREKGGIIKKQKPVVIGNLPAEAEQEIRLIAGEKGSTVKTIEELNPQYKRQGKYEITIDGTRVQVSAPFSAPVQAINIAIAWQALQQLNDQFSISKEEFLTGILETKIGLARFEKLTDSHLWYFDGAHNAEAVQQLKQSVKSIGELSEAILVLSILKDKINREVMEEFSEFENIYYYQLSLERAASFDDINKWLPHVKPFPDDRRQQLFLNDFNSELVIFAGSFYFYTTVRDWVGVL